MITRLTDVFERTMYSPDAAAYLDKAMQSVETTDFGLTEDQKVDLIQQFIDSPVASQAYLAFCDPKLRETWVKKTLGIKPSGSEEAAAANNDDDDLEETINAEAAL